MTLTEAEHHLTDATLAWARWRRYNAFSYRAYFALQREFFTARYRLEEEYDKRNLIRRYDWDTRKFVGVPANR